MVALGSGLPPSGSMDLRLKSLLDARLALRALDFPRGLSDKSHGAGHALGEGRVRKREPRREEDLTLGGFAPPVAGRQRPSSRGGARPGSRGPGATRKTPSEEKAKAPSDLKDLTPLLNGTRSHDPLQLQAALGLGLGMTAPGPRPLSRDGRSQQRPTSSDSNGKRLRSHTATGSSRPRSDLAAWIGSENTKDKSVGGIFANRRDDVSTGSTSTLHQRPASGAQQLPVREPRRAQSSHGTRPETAGNIRANGFGATEVLALGKAMRVGRNGSAPQLHEQQLVLAGHGASNRGEPRPSTSAGHGSKSHALLQEVERARREEWTGQQDTVVRGKQVGGMQPGTGALSAYYLGPWVGHGAFAAVRVARQASDGGKAAIKVYEKALEKRPSTNSGPRDKSKEKKGGVAKSSVAEIRREARILAQCKHESIVRFKDFIETDSQAFLVTEYLPGGSLKRRLEKRPPHRFSEIEARCLFRQIATAVSYLHAASICHRDLKLENLLIERESPEDISQLRVKVIDFGFAVQIPSGQDGTLRTFCGTPPYMSPQMISDQPYCGFACDVWALGVLLYVMLVGRFPFQGETRAVLFSSIRKNHFNVPDFLSPTSVLFITELLHANDRERMSAPKVVQHHWLENSPCSTSVGSSSVGRVSSATSRATSLRVTRDVAAARERASKQVAPETGEEI